MYRARRIGASILAVVTVILLLLASLGWWADRYLLDSQRFTASANEIIDDEDVQDALTVAITDQISQAAGTDLDIVQPFIGSIVDGVVQSDQFQGVFDQAVFRAHDAIVSGDANNAVLNLSTVVDRVRGSIEPIAPAIADDIPDGERLRLRILDKTQLDTVYETLDTVQDVFVLLIVLTIVSFAAALALSPRRWRTLALMGWVTVGLFAARLLAQRIGRGFVGGITDVPEYSKAATSSYQIVLHGLVVQTIAILVIGLVVALFAGWTDRHGGWAAVVDAVKRGVTWAKAQLPQKAPSPEPATVGASVGTSALPPAEDAGPDGGPADEGAAAATRAVVEGVLAPKLPPPRSAVRAAHWWRAAGLLALGLFAVFSPGSLTTVVVILLGIAALYLAVTEAVAAWGSPAAEKPAPPTPETAAPDGDAASGDATAVVAPTDDAEPTTDED